MPVTFNTLHKGELHQGVLTPKQTQTIDEKDQMTPKQIKKSSTKELLIALQNKARCFHSQRSTATIFGELTKRLTDKKDFLDLSIEFGHVQIDTSDTEMFDFVCKKLIEKYN